MTIENAHIQWREDGLPFATDFDDIYFSRDDAEGESRHVFLDANNLRARWQNLPRANRFTIAELGFGSGLNFLLTARLWRELAPPSCRLHYIAFEKHPLSESDIRRLHALWPGCDELSAELLAQYPDHSAGCHRLHFTQNICLDLHYGDAAQALQQAQQFALGAIDCWYLDGFSPARNPALWSADLMWRIGELSHPATTLSSYSVAGSVRHALAAAGFRAQKLPGYGRKRHMLFADRTASSMQHASHAAVPWQRLPKGPGDTGHAVVIGAGLAGCSTAFALARRGWRVTVLESLPYFCRGASGIAPLALRCRIFKQPSAIADFYTHGFLFSHRQYQQLQSETNIGWHPSGVLQLASSLHKRHRDAGSSFLAHYATAVFSAVSQDVASELAGLPVAEKGWYLPLGGWLLGSLLCEAYLSHPAIQVHTDYTAASLQRGASGTWTVQPANPGAACVSADVVVIANAGQARDLEQSSYLPLEQVHGQISHIAATPESQQLRAVVTGNRTVFPARQRKTGQQLHWQHTLAASYARDGDTADTMEVDATNIAGAQSLFAHRELLTGSVCGNQVAIRCNSDDRLPVVGALADRPQAAALLAPLARNAQHQFSPDLPDNSALYHKGLYVNVAHGSNGVATCPLSAELLASMICNEALPVATEAIEALSPIRFLVRQLKQQKNV